MGGSLDLLLVAHDGGGASILACIARTAIGSIRVVAHGPATSVFEEFGLETTEKMPVEVPQLVVVGTSASSSLELDALAHYSASGVRTVAFLDHWENYPGRFTRHGSTVWPHAVAVGDTYALTEARRTLPGDLEVVFWPNPYHAFVIDAVRSSRLAADPRMANELRVLYLSEPADESPHSAYARQLGYTVADVVRVLYADAAEVARRYKGLEVKVRVRRHPRQFDATGQALDEALVEVGWEETRGSLEEALAWCDVAVGTRTNALFVARSSGVGVGVIGAPSWTPHCLPGGNWADDLSAMDMAAQRRPEPGD